MSSKRFFGVFLAIFAFGALPFALVQPSGVASAGLASGFAVIIENPLHLLLFLVLGVIAPLLGRDAVVVMPVAILIMFLMGGLQLFDAEQLRMLPFFTLGGILIVALSLNLIRTKPALFAALVCCSIGFQMGMYYVRSVPEIAVPLFYLIGNALSIALIMGVATSLGLTLIGDEQNEAEMGTPLQRILNARRRRGATPTE